MKQRIMFYCQPVLGMGHLVRSLAILQGLSDFEIWLVNGGRPLGTETRHLIPAGLKIVDLPPLETDAEFREIRMIDPAADPASVQRLRQVRQRMLLESLGQIEPAILLIELYPFGRLKFDFELRPLLEAARAMKPAPRIVCSLRDILVAKRDQAGFEEFALATANRFFDLILVHSDPRFQPLEETFPPAARLTCRIEYTGYVVPPRRSAGPGTPSPSAAPRIVASIGGGRVGIELLRAAMAASRRLYPTISHQLRIFTGPYLPDGDFQQLVTEGDDARWMTISRFTPDLGGEMRGAALSISMAGYNTCFDILTAGVPAIVHPFTGNDNREQTLRARKLEAAGVVRIVTGDDLTPENLAQLIADLLRNPPRRGRLELDLAGVARTAELLRGLMGESREVIATRATNDASVSTGDDGWRELKRTLAAVSGRRIAVFFRDDDAAEDRPSLRRLLGLFEGQRAPLNLEVIPGLLTAAGAQLLRAAATRHPELIGLNQHGWRHENHESTGRKCEFGPSRDEEQQLEDLRRGRQRLEEAFGDAFFPVFTPPWNRCTAVTHRALVALGFAAISDISSKRNPPAEGLMRIPATIDIIDWQGTRDLRPVDELLDELMEQIRAGGPIGILLHHQVMSDAAFDFLARLLDELRAAEAIGLHLFPSLLRQSLLRIDHE